MADPGVPFASSHGGMDRIYDRIEGMLPGITHNTVRQAVWDACEDFCRRTKYWRVRLVWHMPPGVNAFRPRSAPGTEIVTILELAPVYTPDAALNSGRISYQFTPDNVILDRGAASYKTRDRYGNALVVLKPDSLSPRALLPRGIIDDWSEYLSAGAIHRLMMQPSKPWSDLQRAKYYGASFWNGIRLATERARHFNDYQTWHFPYFASGRHVGWGLGRRFGPDVTETVETPVVNIDDAIFVDTADFASFDGNGFSSEFEGMFSSGFGAGFQGGA